MLPARRLSKSRTATPALSDGEEAPDAAATAAVQEEAAANKGKLRKATPDLQDTGPAKKRRKRSSSKTPEASEQASADPDGQVCYYCLVEPQHCAELRQSQLQVDTVSHVVCRNTHC